MIITPIHESNDCHNPAGAGGGQFCSGPDDTKFAPGETVRFDGNAADGSIVGGSMDVTILDPHSNRAAVTQVTKGRKPQAYSGAGRHLPTARVRNARGREFEAFHHTLGKRR